MGHKRLLNPPSFTPTSSHFLRIFIIDPRLFFVKMNLLSLCLFLLGAATCLHGARVPKTGAKQNHYALLVAGSRGYWNYRHQSDIAHAWQIVRRMGVPEENIVTMMYDDVADSNSNPVKGTLINRPGGQDVYQGVVKDYVKDDVTPDNFIKVLSGDAAGMKGIGSGKVIASGPDDHVFVNFADHGGVGLLAFPKDILHVAQFNKTIWKMYEDKKYHKMVMYIEACESGSMFSGTLPSDINVMALTAANGSTSSYACYYDELRKTYLGDLFSVKWMEDSDLGLGMAESLMDQFHTVKAEVNMSQVCMFGDQEIASHYRVAEFQGGETIMSGAPGQLPARKPILPAVPFDAVPAPDVPLHIARKNFELAQSDEEKEAALKEFGKLTFMRQFVDNLVENVVEEVVKDENVSKQQILTDNTPLKKAHGCYESVVSSFHSNCFNLGQNGYPLRKLQAFVNLCEAKVEESKISSILQRVCAQGPWSGAH